jgi:hypothetical protein
MSLLSALMFPALLLPNICCDIVNHQPRKESGAASVRNNAGMLRAAMRNRVRMLICCEQKGSIEERVMAGLRRLGYPFLDQLPSIDHILAPGKLRYQLLEWLFLQYVQSLQLI